MPLKILEQKKNPLLKREEVRAIFEHAGKPTPPRKDILSFLENVLKAKKDLILIDKIFSVKGRGESRLKAFVYSRKEDIPKDKLEVIKRRMEKPKKAEEEKPAEGETPPEGEAKPEEEEGKEEVKPEEKEAEEVKEGEKEGKE